MKQNNMEDYTSKLIDDLLDSISPIEQAQMDAKMLIAAKIADALKSKGWNKKTLLKAIGKENPSIITKWLSGTHNFTIDTLVELENALNIRLLHLEDKKEETIAEFDSIIISKEVYIDMGASYLNEAISTTKQPNLLYYGCYSENSNSHNLIGQA